MEFEVRFQGLFVPLESKLGFLPCLFELANNKIDVDVLCP